LCVDIVDGMLGDNDISAMQAACGGDGAAAAAAVAEEESCKEAPVTLQLNFASVHRYASGMFCM
jgi:hypothetical protein